jgi:hypothetical protein
LHSERVCAEIAPELGYLDIVATVVPGDGRRDGATGVVDQYTGLTHAGNPDARDGDRSRQPLDRLSEGVYCAIAQLVCINRGAVRVLMPGGGPPATAERLPGVVIDDGFA